MADTQEAKPNEPYTTRPTSTLDLEARLARQNETAEERDKRLDEEFKGSATSPFAAAGDENTESLDNFVAVEPSYANYGDVSHEPFASEEGPEKDAEEQILKAMAERDANSAAARGGVSTYGPSVEVDPLGRTEPIVRGGSGNKDADLKAVEAAQNPQTDARGQVQPQGDAEPQEGSSSKPRSAKAAKE